MQVPVPVNPTGQHVIDSSAAAWEGDGLTIVVDEGPFSDSLAGYEDKPEYRVGSGTCVGCPARLVFFTDADGVLVAAARIELDESIMTVTVRTDPRLGPDSAMRIIQSLSIH